MSEPLIIEVPEIETFLPDDDGDEGGDGGDSSIEEINPLLLQRQLYRDTLRTSLRLSTPPIEDLGRRQTEIHEHIVAMQHSPLAEHLGHEFTALLRRAAQQALGSERMLSAGRAGRGGERRTAQTVNASLNHQGRVIRLLLEAARIQREHAAEEGETDAGMEGDEGGEEIVYTLISDPTPPADSETNEEEEHERIARALLAIQEALEQQQQLNQEIEDASEHEAGSAPPPETADEQGEQGEGERTEGDATASDARGEPGGEGPAHTGPTQSFAERQLALQELSQRIERQIEQVRPPESGADPQLAAEQMRQAAAFQREAAEAILRGALEEAASEGAGAEDALQRAMVFTESLLGRDIRFRIEAQSHAPGYQNLIRDYSRRLSYDQ